MSKKVIILIILFIAAAFIANNLDEIRVFVNPEKGLFNDVVLDKFKEKSFDSMFLENSDWEDRNTRDKKITDKMLKCFEKLELKEINEVLCFPRCYRLVFMNSNTYEELWIYISEQNIIRIRTKTIVKEVNEEKGITYYNNIEDNRYYKIKDESIDFNKLEEIWQTIKPNEND